MSVRGALAIDTQHPKTLPLQPVAWQLSLFDGPYQSLHAVEFAGPPVASVLQTLCAGLVALEVGIVDSATKITPRGLFQRFDLSEANGAPLIGERRERVLALFRRILGAPSAESPATAET